MTGYYKCDCDNIIGVCENCPCDPDCQNPQQQFINSSIDQEQVNLPYCSQAVDFTKLK